MTRGIFLLPLALLAAGCGLREPLRPVEGQGTPPAPATMNRALTTDELLTPPPIARPERVDELLRRSDERADDRFDLPPPEVPAGETPLSPQEDDEPR